MPTILTHRLSHMSAYSSSATYSAGSSTHSAASVSSASLPVMRALPRGFSDAFATAPAPARVSLHVGVLGRVRRPFVVLYRAAPSADPAPAAAATHAGVVRAYRELGRTETMPLQTPGASTFIRAFLLPLGGGDGGNDGKRYRVALYDRRNASDNLGEHTFLGCVRFDLDEIVERGVRVDFSVGAGKTGSGEEEGGGIGGGMGIGIGVGIGGKDAGVAVRKPSFLGAAAGAVGEQGQYPGFELHPRFGHGHGHGVEWPQQDARETGEGGDRAYITLRAMHVSDALYRPRRRMHINISVPPSRRSQLPYSLVQQVVDVSVADKLDTAQPQRSWLPLYRSESLREPDAETNMLKFDPIVLPEWRMIAADRELRIRIMLYDSRARCLRAAATAVTSLEMLQEMDPLCDTLPLYQPGGEQFVNVAQLVRLAQVSGGAGGAHDSCAHSVSTDSTSSANAPCQIGVLELRSAEPATFGGVFSISARYFGGKAPESMPEGTNVSSAAALRTFSPFSTSDSDAERGQWRAPSPDFHQVWKPSGGAGPAFAPPGASKHFSPPLIVTPSTLGAQKVLPDRDDKRASEHRPTFFEREDLGMHRVRSTSPVSLIGDHGVEGPDTRRHGDNFHPLALERSSTGLSSSSKGGGRMLGFGPRAAMRQRTPSDASGVSGVSQSSSEGGRLKGLLRFSTPASRLVRQVSLPLRASANMADAAGGSQPTHRTSELRRGDRGGQDGLAAPVATQPVASGDECVGYDRPTSPRTLGSVAGEDGVQPPEPRRGRGFARRNSGKLRIGARALRSTRS